MGTVVLMAWWHFGGKKFGAGGHQVPRTQQRSGFLEEFLEETPEFCQGFLEENCTDFIPGVWGRGYSQETPQGCVQAVAKATAGHRSCRPAPQPRPGWKEPLPARSHQAANLPWLGSVSTLERGQRRAGALAAAIKAPCAVSQPPAAPQPLPSSLKRSLKRFGISSSSSSPAGLWRG